jgi:hypothetical protein
VECEQAERARSVVRQGDVVAAHPGTANWGDRWRRFFVVLSADCDIANGKLDRGLVVVPIVGLETYGLDVWVPEQVRRQSGLAEKRAEPLVRRFPDWGAAARSVLSADPDVLEAELAPRVEANPDLEKPARSLVATCRAAERLRAAESVLASRSPTLGAAVRLLAEAKGFLSGGPVDPAKELRAGLASVSDPKRTDLWPICDLIGLDGQMRDDERDGFVAALRRFTQIPIEGVFVNKTDWLAAPDAYLRVCRLRGPYKTDFLHRFSALFTRVGLDAGRDDEHQRMYDMAAARALARPEDEE